MEHYVNPGKNRDITVDGTVYMRHAIKTGFLQPGDNCIDFIREYASGIYRAGDILSISEKIIALSQNRVIYKKDVKLGFWAKFLSKFVMKTTAGYSVGNPLKMQVAIMLCGLPKVIYASIMGFLGKLIGKRGVFYKIVGPDVSGLDGFYGEAYECYAEMGILNPKDPDKVCETIYKELSVTAMIVDANDLGVEILGKYSGITHDDATLKKMVRDNPAGQSAQQTPLILIRKKSGAPDGGGDAQDAQSGTDTENDTSTGEAPTDTSAEDNVG